MSFCLLSSTEEILPQDFVLCLALPLRQMKHVAFKAQGRLPQAAGNVGTKQQDSDSQEFVQMSINAKWQQIHRKMLSKLVIGKTHTQKKPYQPTCCV